MTRKSRAQKQLAIEGYARRSWETHVKRAERRKILTERRLQRLKDRLLKAAEAYIVSQRGGVITPETVTLVALTVATASVLRSGPIVAPLLNTPPPKAHLKRRKK